MANNLSVSKGERAHIFRLLSFVREFFRLTDIADYLELDPQHVSGYLRTESVPVKYWARVIEMAFYLHRLEGIELPKGLRSSPISRLESCGNPFSFRVAFELLENCIAIYNEDEDSGVASNVKPLFSLNDGGTPIRLALMPNSVRKLQALYRSQNVVATRGKLSKDSIETRKKAVVIWGETSSGKSLLINRLLDDAELLEVRATSVSDRPIKFETLEATLIELPGLNRLKQHQRTITELFKVIAQHDRVTVVLVIPAGSTNFEWAELLWRFLRYFVDFNSEKLPNVRFDVRVLMNKMDLLEVPTRAAVMQRWKRIFFRQPSLEFLALNSLEKIDLADLRTAAGLDLKTRIALVDAIRKARVTVRNEREEILDQITFMVADLVECDPSEIESEMGLGYFTGSVGYIMDSIEGHYQVEIPDEEIGRIEENDITIGELADLIWRLKSESDE